MSTQEQTPHTLSVGTWEIDPSHSTVGFEVRDMTQLIATVRGRFTDYDGTLTVAPDGTAQATGAVRVASLTTDHPQRDEHLRSGDFLDARAHNQIRFRSDQFEAIDEHQIRITGRIELKGVEQPVTLTGKVLGTGVDQRGAERLAIAAHGDLGFGPMKVKLVIDVSAVKNGAQ